jgi:hypothetical protein
MTLTQRLVRLYGPWQRHTILTRNFNLNTSQPASDPKLWFTISLIKAIDCADGFQLDLVTCNDIFTMICGDSCLVSIDDVSYGGSVIHGCGKYDARTSNGSADIPPTVSFNPVGWLHTEMIHFHCAVLPLQVSFNPFERAYGRLEKIRTQALNRCSRSFTFLYLCVVIETSEKVFLEPSSLTYH